MQGGEAGEEAGLFLAAAAVAAAESVAHQCSLTPCRTSSALPLVATCGGEASWPRVAPGAAGGGAAAHCCCCNHKETCPSFFSAPDLSPGSTQQEKGRLGQVGHVAGGVSWLPFGHLSVRSSYLLDQGHGLLQPHYVDPCFYFQVGRN